MGSFADSQDSQQRDSLTARLLEAGAALGWSPQTLTGWQQWAHTASLEALQGATNSAEGRLQRQREAAREGLPIAWRSVPEVPRGGEKTPLVDEKGYGALYRARARRGVVPGQVPAPLRWPGEPHGP
ncbi:MAG: hypothetical protein RML14_03230 [Meiothermus sp.]|uniref:hypothetical protein n=1 Tax=Meiothermus sp. TaxID=1955249 RepID=UPI00298F2B75|nr:hypothetical protein [Meiothermus sp.]MDW8480901.1 hypothetical protein [Meiothermus sp.]